MTGNQIKTVHSHAFRHLPNLVTLILTHNELTSISPMAFVHLDNLQKLDLQFNRLAEFSLATFENCTKYPMHPMTLNISHNQLRHLNPMSSNRVPVIDVVDLGHNQLRKVPRAFLEFLSPTLRRLDLSFNRLTEVAMGSFKQLSLLQTLKMSHNLIMDLSKPAFHGLTSLQILDLGHNKIEVLQFAQFAGLSGLRQVRKLASKKFEFNLTSIMIFFCSCQVDLSHNHLRSLPRDVFQSTVVEDVDLSFNEFVAMPTSALTEAAATIRR